ncbi:MAG: hypothetical protein KBT48_10840 [Firmicutes bacterium]|nr:hypothetical protein [Bacillota bacterium]
MELIKKVIGLIIAIGGLSFGIMMIETNIGLAILIGLISVVLGIYLYLLGSSNVDFKLLERFVKMGAMKIVTWTGAFLLIYIIYVYFFK